MIYVIGDVHGCYKSLVSLLQKIKLKDSDDVYFVGDVVHKGKDSSKVIKLIRESGWKLIMGNHEKKLIAGFMAGDLKKEIVRSYKGKESQLLDDIEFLKTIPYVDVVDAYDYQGRQLVITHGYGYDLLKKFPLDSEEFHERIIKEKIPNRLTVQKATQLDAAFFNVFGHIPLSKPLILPCMAGIDTGCYAGNYLCALSFPEKKNFLQGSLG